MPNIGQILALTKLTSDTPDAVRSAATLMIVGADKSPLISGIASANIVEEATSQAVEASKAASEAATAKADLAAVEPIVKAVADAYNGAVQKSAGGSETSAADFIEALKTEEVKVDDVLTRVNLAVPPAIDDATLPAAMLPASQAATAAEVEGMSDQAFDEVQKFVADLRGRQMGPARTRAIAVAINKMVMMKQADFDKIKAPADVVPHLRGRS